MDLESSQKKKKVTMYGDACYNWTYCDVHFAIYINIKSLNCIPKTNVMLCQLYLNFFKKRKDILCFSLVEPNININL